ncbi:hypothetical protein HELRODRAFT_168273 [Helobdella robusta]|uniref:Uncharacterized protein n=1 Tax=Helobdella robusta TaxID=6412 RepID=T1F0D9_HELRO|nr:hypothetical protein HELRODRAFT_168273 [Helobdella robusta]ESO09310.1 hypothetical protein HELRODRAFT_168273 [Helobdella robusta]
MPHIRSVNHHYRSHGHHTHHSSHLHSIHNNNVPYKILSTSTTTTTTAALLPLQQHVDDDSYEDDLDDGPTYQELASSTLTYMVPSTDRHQLLNNPPTKQNPMMSMANLNFQKPHYHDH